MAELLRQVRLIELRTRGLVTSVLSGEYQSVFKGQGMEFVEVREYQAGDDVRTIDWNVTARMAHPYVKKHVEERELTVLLAVDLSGSEQFGTRARFKAELAAEVAAVLALSAVRNNDRVGLLLFTDRIEHFVPPKKGRRHVLRLIRDVLAFHPAGRGTDLGAALDYAARLLPHRGIIFLLSDFVPPAPAHDASGASAYPAGLGSTPPPETPAEPPWQRSLRTVSRRHDLVAVTLLDPAEEKLPDAGLLLLRDPESFELVAADTGRAELRALYQELIAQEREELRRLFQRLGIDTIDLRTDAPYAGPLLAFFRRRERKLRR
ncbi:MAG: DUF58 domain-containing protein [Gemmatimonadetes bacterium]|nr:DUF58 domain-containing protein [Gemmatimonadota bacterium]